MRLLKTLLLVAGLAAGVHQAHAAPTTWVGNGHEYEVITLEGVTWSDANTAATGSGWHLATITSAAENAFVKSLLSTAENDRSHYWLGGTDATTEGTWTWVTGEAWVHTDWWGGEPNNSGNEDYLAMDLRGGAYAWNDAPVNVGQIFTGFSNGYIVERAVGQVPEPGVLSLLGLGLIGLAAGRRRSRAA